MKHITEQKKQNISTYKFSDETYAQVLDSVAIGCADSILICEDEILFAKRNIDPRAGHWAIIGGRMLAGESPVEAARRKLYLESGLEIGDLERYIFLETYSMYYSVRQQEPKSNGSHTLNFTYVLNISKEERQKLDLSKSEYEEFCWVNKKDVMDFLARENEDIYVKTIMEDLIKL